MTVTETRKKFDTGDLTAEALATSYVDTIRKKDADIHAYLEVFDDVIDQAKEADKKIASGEGRALTGIPFAVKDNILIHGKKASAGSKILESYTATYDATVIKKLKDQGAVFLGRTN